MKRNFRLTRTTDFQRVRRNGKSYAHPLLVLVALPSESTGTRFAVVAGKTVGKAVQRNRAKRLVRAALQPYLAEVTPGWDIILIARKAMSAGTFAQTQAAIAGLLSRAHLI